MKTPERWRTLPRRALLVTIPNKKSSLTTVQPLERWLTDRHTDTPDRFYTLDRWRGREKYIFGFIIYFAPNPNFWPLSSHLLRGRPIISVKFHENSGMCLCRQFRKGLISQLEIWLGFVPKVYCVKAIVICDGSSLTHWAMKQGLLAGCTYNPLTWAVTLGIVWSSFKG